MLIFKKTLILFWLLWWAIALWTDIVGGMSYMGWLQATWAPNTNYPFLVDSLTMYHPPQWLPAVLFIGIILWMALNTALFLYASAALTQEKKIWMARAEKAFWISLSLWLAFFLADQLVMKYDLEENHMVQGAFQLLTFLSLYVLPDN